MCSQIGMRACICIRSISVHKSGACVHAGAVLSGTATKVIISTIAHR